MEEIESHLNHIVLEATKAVMRSDQLESFHGNTAAMYMFLHQFFDAKAKEQEQAAAVSITSKDVVTVLEKVLLPNVPWAHPNTNSASSSTANEEVDFSTTNGPFMSQKTLKETLTGLKVNLNAFAEVVEVCRFLDYMQSATAPFGAVNLVHFVAVYVTLCSTATLFDLIALLWEVHLSDKVRMTIFHLWALVDAANRDPLERLINTVLDHPGLTLPLLLDFFPEVKLIHTAKYVPPSNKDGSTTGGQQPPKEVVYGGDDVGQQAPQPSPPQASTAEAEGATGDDEDEDDYRPVQSEDQGFWNALVS